MNLNERLIRILKQIRPVRSQLVKELNEILAISERTIYARLKGESSFSLSQVESLVQHFSIPLQDIFSSSQQNQIPSSTSLEQFIDQIADVWEIEIEYLQRQSSASLFVCSNDLPFSLVFGYPEIMKFQIYFMYYFLSPDRPEDTTPFQPRSTTYDRLDSICMYIDQIYSELPSVEIWGVSMLRTYVRQLNYVLKQEKISSLSSDKIKKELHSLVDLAYRFTKNKSKQMESSTELYQDVPTFELIYNDLVPVEEYTLLQYKDGKDQTKFRVYNPVFGSILDEDQRKAVENYYLHLKQIGTPLAYADKKFIKDFFKDLHDYIDQ